MSVTPDLAGQPSGSPAPRSAAESPAIQAVNLCMTYPARSRQGQPVTALSDVTISIRQGEFVSLLGPSGCGKSTLLRLVGDLLQPSSGQLLVKGKSAERARRDRD